MIGWLPPEDGALWLAGRQVGLPNSNDFLRQAVQARNVVATRASEVDQHDILRAAPPELREHVSAMKQNQTSAALFGEGFNVALVDLTKVCAIQPQIYTENAAQRFSGVDLTSLSAIASVTLPIPRLEKMPVQFDQTKNAWIFSSPNPNLRIAGSFSGEVQPGVPGFGFVVIVSQSYLQVASYNGRYILRDGYRRAFGLLASGVRRAPCLWKEFNSYQELTLPAGLLPQEAFLGHGPPFPTDYSNDEVSATIETVVTHKMIVVQALEFSS